MSVSLYCMLQWYSYRYSIVYGIILCKVVFDRIVLYDAEFTDRVKLVRVKV